MTQAMDKNALHCTGATARVMSFTVMIRGAAWGSFPLKVLEHGVKSLIRQSLIARRARARASPQRKRARSIQAGGGVLSAEPRKGERTAIHSEIEILRATTGPSILRSGREVPEGLLRTLRGVCMTPR